MNNKNKNIKMNQWLKERVLRVAKYIIETKSTVRETSKEFGVSKSTIHKDVAERLKIINPELHKEVRHILDYHLDVRHIRGGEATRIKRKKVKVE